jgi:hypothetical protein
MIESREAYDSSTGRLRSRVRRAKYRQALPEPQSAACLPPRGRSGPRPRPSQSQRHLPELGHPAQPSAPARDHPGLDESHGHLRRCTTSPSASPSIVVERATSFALKALSRPARRGTSRAAGAGLIGNIRLARATSTRAAALSPERVRRRSRNTARAPSSDNIGYRWMLKSATARGLRW